MLDHEWISDDQRKLAVKIRNSIRKVFTRMSELDGEDLEAT
jgi:hypothetical protein